MDDSAEIEHEAAAAAAAAAKEEASLDTFSELEQQLESLHESELATDDEEGEGEEEMDTMLVGCPDGCTGGDAIVVMTSWGEEVEIVVPEGIAPGDEFEVSSPRPKGHGAAESLDEAEDAPQTMVVVCPEGCGPGDAIVVSNHDGAELEVLIPDGIHEGDEFEVSFG